MKVLLLSPDDRDLTDPTSPIAHRFVRYGALVDRLDVLIPDSQGRTIHLSERVTVYGVRASNKAAYAFRLIPAFFRRHRAERYDLISTRDTYYLGALAVFLSVMTGIGLEVQVHGFEKLDGIRNTLAQFVLRRADSVRAVSDRIRKKLIETFGVQASRITVSPMYIDGDAFRGIVPTRVRRSGDLFTFLTVGRLVPIKNVALQVRALAEVRKSIDARLVIVGDGPLRKSLEELVRRLGLERAVDFIGSTKDVKPFLARADAFLLTSYEEGYGLAPIEAACAGLPVIMTDVGCAGEVIRHEEQGLIIPVDDQAALVAAMHRIIEDAFLRAQLLARRGEIHHVLPTQEETHRRHLISWRRAARHGSGQD